MKFCVTIVYQIKQSQMETANLTSAFKTKQLFLKKNIVVKFSPTKSFKKGFIPKSESDTSISITIPTSAIITNPG